jgi:hypothetical protein
LTIDNENVGMIDFNGDGCLKILDWLKIIIGYEDEI